MMMKITRRLKRARAYLDRGLRHDKTIAFGHSAEVTCARARARVSLRGNYSRFVD